MYCSGEVFELLSALVVLADMYATCNGRDAAFPRSDDTILNYTSCVQAHLLSDLNYVTCVSDIAGAYLN